MKETEILLQQAVIEIKQLRKQNELMAARLDTFDKCMLLIHTVPNYTGQSMSPDLVWEIESHLSGLNTK